MNKSLILLFLIACPKSSCGQTSCEYQPFIKEGKIWNVTYRTHEGYSSYKRTYMIKGDTIIEGKEYKKFFDGDRYIYALREESKKVYAIASTDKFGNPNKEEKLWYDFDVKEGDVIDTGLSYMHVKETDYIIVDGVRYKRFYMYETDKNHLPSANALGVWVEGIGSYRGPTEYRGWYFDGGGSTMDECFESNQCVFTYDDFGTTKLVDVSIDALLYPSDIPTYDLQGRRIETSNIKLQISNLKKGVYIENGRKIVVK